MSELLLRIETSIWIECWVSWACCGYNSLGFSLGSGVPPGGIQLAARRWRGQWHKMLCLVLVGREKRGWEWDWKKNLGWGKNGRDKGTECSCSGDNRRIKIL